MSACRPIDIVKYKQQDIFSAEEYLDLKQRFNPYILDVRSREEFCKGHLCGAHHVETPLPPLYPEDVAALDEKLERICVDGPQSLIIVYCKLGKRAGLAKSILKDLGYSNVLSLGGVDTEPLRSVISGSDPRIPVCQCKVN